MGSDTSVGTDRPAGVLRLPRTGTGAFDRAEFLRGVLRGAPAFIALWGVFWLTGRGMATDRSDVAIALATALPLWIVSRAWRLPWWLHAAAASFPLSIGLIALAHADAAGLVRGAKFAYGAVLFLGMVAWARTPLRRFVAAFVVAVLGAAAFALSWSTWMAVARGPWDLMKGTLDWHNQFAAHMLFGLAAGLFLVVLGRGAWAIVAGVCTAICAAGVILSGSRYGFTLALAIVLAGLLAASIVACGDRAAGPLIRWASVVTGALLLPVLLRSPIFFPGSTASLNPFGTMMRRGGLESSGSIRLEWVAASWEIGADHPLTGSGLLTFATEVVCYGPRAQWHPHNEWAYAWAEGGAVGLVPLLLLLIGVGALVWRSVRPWRTAVVLRTDAARWGALAATVAIVLDLFIEYDLYYTVLVGLFALVGGVAAAPVVRPVESPSTLRADTAWAGLAVAVGVAITAISLDPTFETLPWPVAGYEQECVSG